MNQFEQFQNVLSLEQKSEKIFTFKPDTNYFVGQTPHGGYLMAMMHKALVSVLPHTAAINSNVLYLDRTDADEVELHVEIFKLGKGTSSGQVKLMQQDKINCTFTAICSDFDKLDGFNDMPTPLTNLKKSVNFGILAPGAGFWSLNLFAYLVSGFKFSMLYF